MVHGQSVSKSETIPLETLRIVLRISQVKETLETFKIPYIKVVNCHVNRAAIRVYFPTWEAANQLAHDDSEHSIKIIRVVMDGNYE